MRGNEPVNADPNQEHGKSICVTKGRIGQSALSSTDPEMSRMTRVGRQRVIWNYKGVKQRKPMHTSKGGGLMPENSVSTVCICV